MKVTIELSDKEVKAIKEYIKSSTDNESPTKKDVESEIKGIVWSGLQSGSMGDYYQLFVNS